MSGELPLEERRVRVVDPARAGAADAGAGPGPASFGKDIVHQAHNLHIKDQDRMDQGQWMGRD